MAIDLPVRGKGPAGNRRASGLPGAEDVAQAGIARDPGVAIPQGAFDSGMGIAGEEISGVVDRLAAAQQRIGAREDAVERARATSTYTEAVDAELRRLETEGDFSSPETTKAYGEFLNKTRAEILGSHKGSEDSRANLEIRLESIYSEAAGRAGAKSVAAQRKLVTDHLGQQVNAMAAKVIEDPNSLPDMFASLDAEIDNFAPALTPEEERGWRQAARSQLLVSAVETSIARPGGLAEAEKVLSMPGFASVVDPDTQRKLRTRITVAKAAEEKELRAGEAKVNELRQILGREPTAEERARLGGVARAEGRQTLSGKISEFEQAVGRPANEQEIAKMAGVATAESSTFGAGITGRALEIMTEDAPSFAAGLLSEPEERRFISAVTHYTQPLQFQNPDTGLMETRRPELPPFVADALRRKGVDPQAVQSETPEAPADDAAAIPDGSPVPEQAAEDAGQPRRPLWQRAGNIAGPVPTAAAIAGKTPGVGSLIGPQEITQDRAYAVGLTNDIVRVLQNSPKFAEMERSQIKKEVGLEPGTFDTPTAFRDRVMAVDELLEERQNDAIKTIQNRTMIGKEDYQRSLTLLNDIANIRSRLGVPPRVKSASEVRKMIDAGEMKSGDQFIDPNGILRSIP